METITGVENLKDEWRKTKIKYGDLRGLSNRFALSEKFGINPMQTYFYSAGGNGKVRIEVWADIYTNGKGGFRNYSIKELVKEVTDITEGEITIIFGYNKWNEHRTDSDQ